MDIFGIAALTTIARFAFWLFEGAFKILMRIARWRRTMREVKNVPGERISGPPRD